jgi:hypothetical protein
MSDVVVFVLYTCLGRLSIDGTGFFFSFLRRGTFVPTFSSLRAVSISLLGYQKVRFLPRRRKGDLIFFPSRLPDLLFRFIHPSDQIS